MEKSVIKLKNVSKFYYSKGVIASGFTRLNLEFKMGEFVVITGESGSGKSTLLNVISGLDSYEEGEMYINGEETSHYTEEDFEDYRRRYIGNIFQTFNLVNSYTVYQNIELVMLLNGVKKKDVKDKVLDLIRKVDLYKFRNTKVSKLSGGQKQRVAIARALAKDTPIIIADEPTGNLDSRSSKSVLKLLSEISKDKLVIVVTHNYEDIEEYATRKIKMHDGKVLEDRQLKKYKEVNEIQENDYKNIRFLSKIRLGIRNTFNIIPKFLLVLLVYLFITTSLISEYASFREEEHMESINGYNGFFIDTNEKRVVIKKEDKTSFSDEDYSKIESIANVDYIIKNDLLLDTQIDLSDDNFWLTTRVNGISNFRGKVDKGRMPENDREVIMEGSKNGYYIGYMADEIMNKELYLRDMYTGELDKNNPVTIVGISYTDSNNYYDDGVIYVNDNILDNFTYQINQSYSSLKVLFQGKYYSSTNYDMYFRLVPKSNIPEGMAYISSDLNYLCKNEYCIGSDIIVDVDNIYYKDTLNLKVGNTYSKWNVENLVGTKDYDGVNGAIFISSADYNKLFNRNSYQSSVFVKNVHEIDDTISKLNDNGYITLKLTDALVNPEAVAAIRILKTIVTVILVVVLFFISYFVIKVILKSRNVYFTTIRMLGASKKISRELLIIELINVANIAYILFGIFLIFNYFDVINVKFAMTILDYLQVKDYILLYVILIMMSYLISTRFAKKIFKDSAMKTLKEEV